ncbi:uncharacterized protein LOC125496616 [Beta vulgaris subsp. vulgaris]|uniref:uncharacterized protein LOC125496616 n=1 Tax=Beta vulgaris subsp. vulgaris TaxID=3555 RepID=UPI002036DCEA|nr:uncharacterized protein LOC125496616 [Beta vulgaris subsp. vulgaris]
MGFFITFIYGFNERNSRVELWEDLKAINTIEPWVICGDFNCIISTEERIGAPVREAEMADMRECLMFCGLQGIKSTGNFFTWNNKQEGGSRVFSKLDRVIANQAWIDGYPSAEVSFQNEGEFDHTPALLIVYPIDITGRKPFKYFTMWRTSPQFMDIIIRVWNGTIQGTKMYQVMRKLRSTKAELKILNKEGFSDIQAADIQAYNKLMRA